MHVYAVVVDHQVRYADCRHNRQKGSCVDESKEALAAGLGELRERLDQRRAASEIAYTVIREAIRRGMIRPGARLIEVELGEALAMSRTPVHEALRRLEAEHFVERAPRGGLVVPTITLDDLIEIFEIREMLEGLAARRAAERMSQAETNAMRETVERMERALAADDFERVSESSNHYHRILRSGAKYTRLPQLLSWLLDSHRTISAHEFGTPERTATAVAEHRAIYEAIADRDPQRAEMLAREHSRNALTAQILAHHLDPDTM